MCFAERASQRPLRPVRDGAEAAAESGSGPCDATSNSIRGTPGPENARRWGHELPCRIHGDTHQASRDASGGHRPPRERGSPVARVGSHGRGGVRWIRSQASQLEIATVGLLAVVAFFWLNVYYLEAPAATCASDIRPKTWRRRTARTPNASRGPCWAQASPRSWLLRRSMRISHRRGSAWADGPRVAGLRRGSDRVWRSSASSCGCNVDRYLKGTIEWIVLVDISGTVPEFYLVPGERIRAIVKRKHEAFLGRVGGVRPRNPESKHSRIEQPDVQRWRNRWSTFDE